MPIECWRLQGFTNEQFHKVEALGMSDAQLYKQAGNAVTTKVIEAIGRRLKAFDEKYGGEIYAESYYEPPALIGGSEPN